MKNCEVVERKIWDMDGEDNVLLKKYNDGSIALCMSYDCGYCYTGTSKRKILEELHKALGDMLYGS